MNNNLKLNVWKLENIFKKLPDNYREKLKGEIYCQDQYGQLGIAYISQDEEGRIIIKTIDEIS